MVKVYEIKKKIHSPLDFMYLIIQAWHDKEYNEIMEEECNIIEKRMRKELFKEVLDDD